MKIVLFIVIGFIAGYVVNDLLHTENEITYVIKKLRAKKGAQINVDENLNIESKRKTRRERRKKKK